ncbi:MAG: hypothetical protein HC819_10345 [Cyclobacteriaceae bacterium]|nr:hypothetical protein [Cyclobacteriaceae bacterium]
MNRSKKQILFILLVLIIVSFVAYEVGERVLSNTLVKKVQKTSAGHYTLAFDKLTICIFPLGVELDSVRLWSENKVYAQLDSTTFILPEISVKTFGVHGLSLWKLVFENEFNLAGVTLVAPVLSVAVTSRDTVPAFSLESPESGKGRKLVIGSVEVREAAVKATKGKSKLECRVEVALQHLSAGQRQSFTTQVEHIEVSKFVYRTPDGFYDLKMDGMHYMGASEELKMLQMEVEPLVGKYEIGKLKGHESDWVKAEIGQLTLQDFEVGLLIDSGDVVMSKAELSGVRATIFRDKRQPFPDIPDKKLPSQRIGGFDQKLHIDTLLVSDTDITYIEHISGDHPGTALFKDIQIKGGPLANAQNTRMVLAASAMIMDRGLLEADFEFAINDSTRQSKVKGTMHQIELAAFNPMTNYVANLNIKSGMLNSMDFNFEYNHRSSHGEMRMLYKDLDFELVETEGKKMKAGLDEKLMTFVAKSFIVKKKNEAGEQVRIGNIEFERDPKKLIFNYWWKSILSGVKSSAGLSEEK